MRSASSPRAARPGSPRWTRVAAVVTGLVLATATLSGCVQRESNAGATDAPELVPTDQLSEVTLQVGDQKGGTEALLRASGQLDDAPYTVAFSTFISGPPQIEAATAGKIDFAVTGNTPPVFGVASDARIKVVSAYANNASGDRILVAPGSPLKSVQDLRGKRVAVGKGSSAHGHLLLQLKKAGLAVDDLEWAFLQPADAQTAFQAGQVDAWAVWDPYTAIAQLGSGVDTLTTAEGVSNGYGFGIASDQALADPAKNTALRDLVTRIARASQWAVEHPDEWSADYAAAVGIDPEAAKLAQGRSLRPAIALDDDVIASEQELLDAFVDSGEIRTEASFGDYVDTRYNDAVPA
ncbi:ABC transporter substrate-binding protein [Rhodococcus sp. HNM0569]|uniref:ABC transporter substrate-binding protein n=1 Tax=Rhodococcus sp. HNM0569 TaxID=2716340 RepID=UPI00146E5318|nr:ABC transporter substrate-binding protein [Rhodococcus sp. HNM0569]NLU82334.1 ABC transporter substrate-binding protein [Rhodococcus sp. HNM0569]